MQPPSFHAHANRRTSILASYVFICLFGGVCILLDSWVHLSRIVVVGTLDLHLAQRHYGESDLWPNLGDGSLAALLGLESNHSLSGIAIRLSSGRHREYSHWNGVVFLDCDSVFLFYQHMELAFFPMFASNAYDKFGNRYDVQKILTLDKTFDPLKYEKYSPLFLPCAYVLAFGLSFASITAVVSHVGIFHGKEIWRIWQRRKTLESADIHEKLMKEYPEVPDLWYAVLFLMFFGIMCGVCVAWPTETPIWVLVVGICIALVWFLPVGFVQAITNYQLGLNVFAEFLVGYMWPGRPIAMMIFKTITYITMAQGLSFVLDLKFGHYMKLPPRITFWTQLWATLWACFVQIGILDWALVNIPEVCSLGGSLHMSRRDRIFHIFHHLGVTHDCKLAVETKATTILQLSLYSECVAAIQGEWPDKSRHSPQ